MIAVGIDVSKAKSTVAILNGDGSIRAKPFDVHHVADELQALVDYIQRTSEPSTILMEPTSHYHYPLLKTFQDAKLPVCLINPYQMKKYGDTELRKAKTDKRDALRIAQYALEKSYSLLSMHLKNRILWFLTRLRTTSMRTFVSCPGNTVSGYQPSLSLKCSFSVFWMKRCQTLQLSCLLRAETLIIVCFYALSSDLSHSM